MPRPWSDWPQADGVIVAKTTGRRVAVRLDDGREVEATFRRRDSLFGNPIGWRVRIAFRPDPLKPAFVIKRYTQAGDEVASDPNELIVGGLARVTAGTYEGFDVVVLAIDAEAQKARVVLAVFGGSDAAPFEIDLSNLRKCEAES